MIYFRGINKPYVVAMDIEYDQGRLIQFAGIMFCNVGDGLYKVCKSLNMYIQQEHISYFIRTYTHITNAFLDECGITHEKAIDRFYNEFLSNTRHEDLVFVSHGIKQDLLVLANNGIDIGDCETICTYNMAKEVLHRNCNIRLGDILQESGIIPFCEHNAYADARNTAEVLSFLLGIGEN